MFGWLTLAMLETLAIAVLTLIYTSVVAFSWIFVMKAILSVWIINIAIASGFILFYRRDM